jgi:DNA/RNA-binding domain of Phe-tRNA-synthetase-like protein
MSKDMSYCEALLHKRVRIKLDEGVHVEGILLRWSESGEVVYRDDSGTIMHAWPLLGIEPS